MAPLLARGFLSSEVNNLAAVLAASNQEYDKAAALWRSNLENNPNDVDSCSNLGRMLEITGNLESAVEYLQRAVALAPNHANSHLNLGVAYSKMHLYDEAITCYHRVLQIEPSSARAWFNMGKALHSQQRFPAASAAYEKAIELDPREWDAQTNLLFSQHYLEQFDVAANRDLARSLGQKRTALAPAASWVPQRLDPDKAVLRIGFVSADLRTHPVGFFLEGLIASLGSSDVSLYAYANSHTFDDLSARLRPAFVQWENVTLWTDAALAARIAQDGIDILIDLSGHSAGNRLNVFASRAAPVQMSWLGYFSTTGVPAMDFVLADPHCAPDSETAYFTERVLRLPRSRYCFTPLKQNGLATAMPYLKRGGIRFACYQTQAKINTRVLKCWAAILAADSLAELVVYSKDFQHAKLAQSFLERIGNAGINASQVELRAILPYEQYLQSYADVDVLLDTFPYPGGTTTAEALWMGVPTLTLAKPGMLGRQGQAILTIAGLAQWVTHSEAEYTAAGQALARRTSPLLASAQALRANPQAVRSSALFDTQQFVRDWTAALRQAWVLRCAEINAS